MAKINNNKFHAGPMWICTLCGSTKLLISLPKNNLIGVKTNSSDSYRPPDIYDLPCRPIWQYLRKYLNSPLEEEAEDGNDSGWLSGCSCNHCNYVLKEECSARFRRQRRNWNEPRSELRLRLRLRASMLQTMTPNEAFACGLCAACSHSLWLREICTCRNFDCNSNWACVGYLRAGAPIGSCICNNSNHNNNSNKNKLLDKQHKFWKAPLTCTKAMLKDCSCGFF